MESAPDSEAFTFRPIGRIRTPYPEAAGVPRQGALAEAEGTVELSPGLEAGLEGIERFSHLILLYVFHRSSPEVPLRQKDGSRGVFSIRSPLRPNPIGLTVVRLLSREGSRLRVRGVDMIDGSPLLDIKPYSVGIDAPAEPAQGIFRPIGYIRTPYAEAAGTPIQGTLAETEGTVELLPEFEEGLEGIEGFSHLILLYVFDRSSAEVPLRQKPFLGDTERGVFAIRSPLRPNPIGLTVVRLLSREGSRLRVRGVDMTDATPLLDIKPFVARFDAPAGSASGWLEPHLDKAGKARADGRFSGGRPK